MALPLAHDVNRGSMSEDFGLQVSRRGFRASGIMRIRFALAEPNARPIPVIEVKNRIGVLFPAPVAAIVCMQRSDHRERLLALWIAALKGSVTPLFDK
jgi:hypothetical protein